jgi:hypothetical protein
MRFKIIKQESPLSNEILKRKRFAIYKKIGGDVVVMEYYTEVWQYNLNELPYGQWRFLGAELRKPIHELIDIVRLAAEAYSAGLGCNGRDAMNELKQRVSPKEYFRFAELIDNMHKLKK